MKKTNNTENEIKCEGNCLEDYGKHAGKVISVTVSSETLNPIVFNYCQNAIKEDIRRGFIVKPN